MNAPDIRQGHGTANFAYDAITIADRQRWQKFKLEGNLERNVGTPLHVRYGNGVVLAFRYIRCKFRIYPTSGGLDDQQTSCRAG